MGHATDIGFGAGRIINRAQAWEIAEIVRSKVEPQRCPVFRVPKSAICISSPMRIFGGGCGWLPLGTRGGSRQEHLVGVVVF